MATRRAAGAGERDIRAEGSKLDNEAPAHHPSSESDDTRGKWGRDGEHPEEGRKEDGETKTIGDLAFYS